MFTSAVCTSCPQVRALCLNAERAQVLTSFACGLVWGFFCRHLRFSSVAYVICLWRSAHLSPFGAHLAVLAATGTREKRQLRATKRLVRPLVIRREKRPLSTLCPRISLAGHTLKRSQWWLCGTIEVLPQTNSVRRINSSIYHNWAAGYKWLGLMCANDACHTDCLLAAL